MRNLVFNSFNPVPKLIDFPSYREAQIHSREVDEWLGMQVDESELKLARDENLTPFDQRERWVGLNPDALQTPYTECRTILDLIQMQPGQTLVDLGAGYARMGIVMGLHFPDSHYIGYEVAPERVAEARRVLSLQTFKNVQLMCEDLANPAFKLPEADYYFVYDFGSPGSIAKILHDLKQIALIRQSVGQSIKVIGRGRGCRDRIEKFEPWLSEVHQPQVFPHFSIYRS
jgi:hypothetical protein